MKAQNCKQEILEQCNTNKTKRKGAKRKLEALFLPLCFFNLCIPLLADWRDVSLFQIWMSSTTISTTCLYHHKCSLSLTHLVLNLTFSHPSLYFSIVEFSHKIYHISLCNPSQLYHASLWYILLIVLALVIAQFLSHTNSRCH